MTKKQIAAARKATAEKLRELFKPENDGQTLEIVWWGDESPLRVAEVSFTDFDGNRGSTYMRCDSGDLLLRTESYAVAHAFTNGKIAESEEFYDETSQLERAVQEASDEGYLRNLAWRLSLYHSNKRCDVRDCKTAMDAINRMAKRAGK